MKSSEIADADQFEGGRGTPGEVFNALLKLGLTSFGGPIAHLGYFRDELVIRRKWISEAGYADLVALCQFLPGPAISQVGFALGLMRGGPFGALAAWTAFTLPSALILLLFALSAAAWGGPVGMAVIHGLKIVAVAIVAHAVWGMARSLCPDRERASIAVGAVIVVVGLAGSFGQVAAIVAGGLAGLMLCRGAAVPVVGNLTFRVPRRAALIALVAFFALLIGLPLLAAVTDSQTLNLIDSFYRAGSLVFGGGHVVLPLLGAVIALVTIFVPGFLLVVAALPYWDDFRTRPNAQAAMRGANAAVVGILGAALYSPVFTSAILSPADFALALVGFLLLTMWKMPPWVVVIALAVGHSGKLRPSR